TASPDRDSGSPEPPDPPDSRVPPRSGSRVRTVPTVPAIPAQDLACRHISHHTTAYLADDRLRGIETRVEIHAVRRGPVTRRRGVDRWIAHPRIPAGAAEVIREGRAARACGGNVSVQRSWNI